MKAYYRLSELNETCGLSDADIQYLNTDTEVSFCLYCKSTYVLIGGWVKGKFSCFGQAKYAGLISMTQNQQVELFENSKIYVGSSTILQQNKMAHYSTVYPFTVEMPNTVIEKWLATPFDKIPFEYMPFYFYPQERTSMLKEFENMCKGIASSRDTSTPYEPPKPIKTELFHHSQSFTLDDACITSDELKKANSYFSRNIMSNLEDDEPKQLVNSTQKNSRPIDLLLQTMLKQYPDAQANQVWNKLGEDILNEPRLFDTDEIIDEIGNDILYWFDTRSELKQMKKKSFYNLIRELKKT
ncbi:hypothetical protein [Shewanella psychromarinicola]|uniref:Uncharacterized protein n=1 Tax=Shewanella psychromarinicola TaxID=2487742 RepID=A0A3N4E887_9GAMM|nr:hypothetical protein [Shewanella psychromarinicola]AZG35206.1 hypothetical protein EGC80_09920 [Shewanella psychromarinicola]MCL1082637.1 hypothetical protein [Shewanella psychromarinicola]RPA32992.1 hypothetical protein EGC77_06410 [Shewanella psychromarinicola]